MVKEMLEREFGRVLSVEPRTEDHLMGVMGGWKQMGKAISFRHFVLAAILAQPLANGTGYEVGLNQLLRNLIEHAKPWTIS